MKKILFWLFLLIIPAGLGSQLFVSKLYEKVTIEQISQKTIKIILVGDIMLDRGVQYMIDKKGNGDFRFPFLKIAGELKKADIVFGNLEGPISEKGTKVGSIYSFRMDPKTIDGLSFANINVVSLANNHAFDYGREALEDTLNRLNAAGISYTGAGLNEREAFSPIIKEINGVKIGFLAYTNLGPEVWRARAENSGITWINNDILNSIKNDVEKAKSQVDILIVSLHAGEEYQKTPTPFQIDFNRTATEAGADLVVNHHPHIVQSNLYSLGNFIFDQGFSEETMKSEIIEVQIQNKKIKEIIKKNIKINNFFQPELLKWTLLTKVTI